MNFVIHSDTHGLWIFFLASSSISICSYSNIVLVVHRESMNICRVSRITIDYHLKIVASKRNHIQFYTTNHFKKESGEKKEH